MEVPFFRVDLSPSERTAVVDVLESGWLTTGPKTRQFERDFRGKVGCAHSVAVASGTAAMHLAIEALGVEPGDGVLVPTMTFAATAEVVRYTGAIPVLVDCRPRTGNLDLEDAARKIEAARAGQLPREGAAPIERVVGIMPVHVGGYMIAPSSVAAFAKRHDLWVVEDAAHAFTSAWRENEDAPWRQCGEDTADCTCFSFYANKTITSGEGGMIATGDRALAKRMRLMSLHGLSNDSWRRRSGGAWDYRIDAPGYKYNLTDIHAALGLAQLGRADSLRLARQTVADAYYSELESIAQLELPPRPGPDRIHSWHLFPIKLNLDTLRVDRDFFVEQLHAAGVGFSVHWRPLHLHPYYQRTFDWRPEDLPVATREWRRLVSLPIFPSMRQDESVYVIESVEKLCRRLAR